MIHKNKVKIEKVYKFLKKQDLEKIIEKFYRKKEKIEIDFVGQDRAIDTLKFAISVKKDKYNVYAAGTFGLGKKTIIQKILEDIAKNNPPPDDWIYIYNFENPDEPICVRLPNSTGKAFKEKLENTIKNLKQTLKKAFEEDRYIQS
ncbi:MAG: Lon-like protease helical domain-containing protein, partial [bacterium]